MVPILRLLLTGVLLWVSMHKFMAGAEPTYDHVQTFQREASQATSPQFIDKISHVHMYSLMYGMFLIPMISEYHSKGRPVKMLEIGLGCWKNYKKVPVSTKKSAHIWNALLTAPADEIFIAEYDEPCALDWKQRGIVPSKVKLLLGDQSNASTVASWVTESRGKFDFIIDDGGHSNLQIYTSFLGLWHAVNPGGFYFIEDMQVGRRKDKEDSNGKFIMADVIKDWIEQLLMPRRLAGWNHKIPDGIRWIMCQNHACMIQKCFEKDLAHCSGQGRGDEHSLLRAMRRPDMRVG